MTSTYMTNYSESFLEKQSSLVDSYSSFIGSSSTKSVLGTANPLPNFDSVDFNVLYQLNSKSFFYSLWTKGLLLINLASSSSKVCCRFCIFLNCLNHSSLWALIIVLSFDSLLFLVITFSLFRNSLLLISSSCICSWIDNLFLRF